MTNSAPCDIINTESEVDDLKITQKEINRLMNIARKRKSEGFYGDSEIIKRVVKKILENDEKLLDRWELREYNKDIESEVDDYD